MGAVRAYAWEVAGASVALSVSAATDRGLVRRVNEDSYHAVPPVFLVADGMGGHSFGDKASQATAHVFATRTTERATVTVHDILAAVQEADRLVQALGDEQVAGTTLAGVALVSDPESGVTRWMTFNVGDSRVYRWGASLEQLSTDHSAVQELIDGGQISPDEARAHPERNVVTRAVGVGDADPDVRLFAAEGFERFVVCSDGLTKELDDATILEVLSRGDDEDSPADRLVRAALAAGGDDNVTVVVVEAAVTRLGATALPPDAVVARLEDTRPRV